MIVYIAGKITGDPEYKQKFARAAAAWRAAGQTVINPASLPEGLRGKDYMRICTAMMEAADIIILLRDWQESKGARIEKLLAEYTEKAIIYYDGQESEKGDSYDRDAKQRDCRH